MFKIINYGIADRGKKGILDSHIGFVLGKPDYVFIPILFYDDVIFSSGPVFLSVPVLLLPLSVQFFFTSIVMAESCIFLKGQSYAVPM